MGRGGVGEGGYGGIFLSTHKEEAQAELFKADVTWFHIFKEIVRSETWARMSANAKAVYPAIKAFVNWESGSAFPSIDTIERFSGVSRPSVVKALKELEELGLLVKNKSKGRSTNYGMIEKFDVKDESGNHAASVSFDYIPSSTANAIAEFKRILSSGFVSSDGKTNFIKIDTLNLNIHTGSGDNLVNNIFSGLDQRSVLKGIMDIANKVESREAKLISELASKYTNEAIPPRD
jgi:hypothetical protein